MPGSLRRCLAPTSALTTLGKRSEKPRFLDNLHKGIERRKLGDLFPSSLKINTINFIKNTKVDIEECKEPCAWLFKKMSAGKCNSLLWMSCTLSDCTWDYWCSFSFFFYRHWMKREREAPTKTNKQKTFSLCLYIYLYWMCKLILLQDLMANWSNRSMETGQWKRFIDCFILLWSSFWPCYLDDFVFGFSFTCTGLVLICRILYIHVQYRNAYFQTMFMHFG